MKKNLKKNLNGNTVKLHYFRFFLTRVELDINGVAIQNSVFDSGRFPYNKNKMRRKVHIRLLA